MYIMYIVHPERGEETYEVEEMYKAMEAFTHFVIMAHQHGEYNRVEIRTKNRDGSIRVLVAFDHNGLGVPKMPTERMINAAILSAEWPERNGLGFYDRDDEHAAVSSIWSAMIEVA